MSYLIYNDYKKLIQTDNLQQIINEDDSILAHAQLAAVTEICSYLTQKYKVWDEFTDTLLYDPQVRYSPASRVYVDAPAFNASKIYARGELALYGGIVYAYIDNVSEGPVGSFVPQSWVMLGTQYQIYYVPYPVPLFNYKASYVVGYPVYWNKRIYVAKVASLAPTSHEAALQGVNYESIPYRNIFPDDPVYGEAYWNEDGIYTTNSGTLYAGALVESLPQYGDTFPASYTAGSDFITELYIPSIIGYTIIQMRKDTALYTLNQFYADYNNGYVNLLGTSISSGETIELAMSNSSGSQWTSGDNRNAMMVNNCIDVVLYHIHSRISPRNIPDLRVKRYDDVISWLKNVAKGTDITADLPLVQPKSGGRIRWGGGVKNINSY